MAGFANLVQPMKIPMAVLGCILLIPLLLGQPGPIKTGPEPGSPIPRFTAVDQNGVSRTSGSILGANGALLVFFRSADW